MALRTSRSTASPTSTPRSPAPATCTAGSSRRWTCATGRDALLRVDPRGAVFLGCRFAEEPVDVGGRLRAGGALLFPALPDLPFDPYRPLLYFPEELYGVVDGARPPYATSPDSTVYGWTRSPPGRTLTGDLAATLHDHSVGGALDDVTERLDPTRVVGVMGGHALRRSDPA